MLWSRSCVSERIIRQRGFPPLTRRPCKSSQHQIIDASICRILFNVVENAITTVWTVASGWKLEGANRHVHCVMFWMNNKFKTPAVTSQKACRTVPVRWHNLITEARPLYDAPDSKCFFSSLLVNSSYSCQNWVQNWVDRMEKYQSQIWRGLNYWICTVE